MPDVSPSPVPAARAFVIALTAAAVLDAGTCPIAQAATSTKTPAKAKRTVMKTSPAQEPAMTDLRALERTIRDTWDFHDPKLSEQRFDSLAATPGVARNAAALAIVRTQIARAQGLQRSFDEAQATLSDVAVAVDSLTPGRDAFHAQARLAIERGRVFNSSGEPGRARPLFEDAYALADSAGQEALVIDAAHMLAIAAGRDDAPQEALAWNERALARAESASDPQARDWRASLLNNLGWARHDAGQFDHALDLFQRALVARREQGDSSNVRVARWAVARCLRSLGRYDEALAQQQQLEKDCAVANAPDGYVYEELAENLFALGRKDEAKPYFVRAYDELAQDPWFVESEAARLARLKKLGGSP